MAWGKASKPSLMPKHTGPRAPRPQTPLARPKNKTVVGGARRTKRMGKPIKVEVHTVKPPSQEPQSAAKTFNPFTGNRQT